MTPEQYQQARWEREIDERNRPLSDEELDAMLPGPEEGYKIMNAPAVRVGHIDGGNLPLQMHCMVLNPWNACCT